MLLPRLDSDLAVSMVLDPFLTFEELLIQALGDFGALPGGPLACAGATRQHLLAILNRFLGPLAAQQASAVIIIDDAHNLSPAVLQQLRLLSNFETEDATLLQVVLVGQEGLEERLTQPDLVSLGQRVSRRYVLQPLSPAETGRYIERRLAEAAGLHAERQGVPGDGEPAVDDAPVSVRFTPSALRVISAHSGGNPRAINHLCDRTLEVAHAEGLDAHPGSTGGCGDAAHRCAGRLVHRPLAAARAPRGGGDGTAWGRGRGPTPGVGPRVEWHRGR
jgi:general secretion pathway protein A